MTEHAYAVAKNMLVRFIGLDNNSSANKLV